jgi:dipeptidyl-peptidase-4
MKFHLLLTASLVGCLLRVPTNLQAQPSPPSWVDGTTLSRLKDVYERGAFRAKRFDANWSADSTGYFVEQRDSESKQTSRVFYDVRTGEPNATPEPVLEGEETRPPQSLISPDGKQQLEFRGGDVFVRNRETSATTQLTNRATDREVSYRNLRWSPDGKYVALVESDYTDVKKRSMLVPDDPSYPGVREQHFARVGGTIATLRVGIVDVETKELVWLPIESPTEGFYLGIVEWTDTAGELLVERMSRFRDTREFVLASVDGTLNSIFDESNPAWVVASQAKNAGLTWIRDGQAFIVISEKDGWRHAFLVSREGDELALLTPGEYDIIDRAVVDEVDGWYYFYASPDNATEKYLYRVPLDGSGTLERITPRDQPGTHNYDFSPDANWAFHTVSTFDAPPITELINVEGHRRIKIVEDNANVQSRANDVVSQPTEFIQLDIGNDITLDAWMIKPKDFDETKKYPIFIYVYGEPHAQTVLNVPLLQKVPTGGVLSLEVSARSRPTSKRPD